MTNISETVNISKIRRITMHWYYYLICFIVGVICALIWSFCQFVKNFHIAQETLHIDQLDFLKCNSSEKNLLIKRRLKEEFELVAYKLANYLRTKNIDSEKIELVSILIHQLLSSKDIVIKVKKNHITIGETININKSTCLVQAFVFSDIPLEISTRLAELNHAKNFFS